MIAPSSHRTCSTLKLPPEAGEALSFLGEVPMAPLGIEALSANSILLENCPIHPYAIFGQEGSRWVAAGLLGWNIIGTASPSIIPRGRSPPNPGSAENRGKPPFSDKPQNLIMYQVVGRLCITADRDSVWRSANLRSGMAVGLGEAGGALRVRIHLSLSCRPPLRPLKTAIPERDRIRV